MAPANGEIRGFLVRVGDERVLLPNAAVAELIARVPVQPLADTPHWMPGTIAWRGWQVPVFSMAGLGGFGHETVAACGRIVVLKTLTGSATMPYVGLMTGAVPRLITVPRDGLLADASQEPLPQGVRMRVLLGEEGALLPDLDVIERMIADALAQPA